MDSAALDPRKDMMPPNFTRLPGCAVFVKGYPEGFTVDFADPMICTK